MDGVYQPIEVEHLAEDTLQGHSDVLDPDIRWHGGRLEWYDPGTGRHIVTLDDKRTTRQQAEARNCDSRKNCDDCAAARGIRLLCLSPWNRAHRGLIERRYDLAAEDSGINSSINA